MGATTCSVVPSSQTKQSNTSSNMGRPNLTLNILKTGRTKIGGLFGPPPKLVRTDTDVSADSLKPVAADTYHVVALDLDGTLLRRNKTISDKTVAYLQGLHARGVAIIIATGRAAPSVYATVIRLNLPEPIAVVCSNGSYGFLCIPDPTLDCGVRIVKELFSFPVPKTVTEKALQLSNKLGCVLQYYMGNNIYANPSQDKHYKLTELYSSLTGVDTIYVKDNYQSMLFPREHQTPQDGDGESSVSSVTEQVEAIYNDSDKSQSLLQVVNDRTVSSLPTSDSSSSSNSSASSLLLPSKLLVLCPKHEMPTVWKAFTAAFGKDEATLVYGAQGWFLEILYPQVCKGFGLEQMCRELQHDVESVIAFGDADNDVEFLQVAGKGVVMKNGRNVAKKVADEVTEYTNNEDGVRRALQQMEKEGLLHFEYSS